jgi:hypothetical protein
MRRILKCVVVGAAIGVASSIGPGRAQIVQAANGSEAPRVRVLQRELLGRYIDDLDFVSNGPLANHIVLLNGHEVHGMLAGSGSHHPIRNLFDLREQLLGLPSGIAYIASERLFAVVDAVQPTAFFLTDDRGTPRPPRLIRFIGDVVPDWMDGLAYVPSTSLLFPDHLLTVTYKIIDGLFDFRIQVIRLDGQVVTEILIPQDLSNNGVVGVAFLAPDRILVSDWFNRIWTLDFQGHIAGGPRATERLLVDGIVQLPDGRVVTSEGAQLRFYDAALNRSPHDDRDAGTRMGLVVPSSLAWNPDTFQHLLVSLTEESGAGFDSLRVAAAPLSLATSSSVLDLSAFPTPLRAPVATYMPDQHLIAVALRRRGSTPAQIVLYDSDGTLLEVIDASAIGGLGRPYSIDYVPHTREFVLIESTQSNKLKFLTRTGALARQIDLLPIGMHVAALSYFEPRHPSGGQFLIIGADEAGAYRAVITDFAGHPISEFDPRKELGLAFVTDVSAITLGPLTVAFAALESAVSPRLVTFLLR